ncbi:MAG: tryptophan synthase subunit alpha, partial [Planctomycetota bacterium]
MTANRIDVRFEELREKEEAAFIPFLTAGDPDIDTTQRLIIAAEDAGADMIELGFPFSDPVADGATIQASYTRVLEQRQSTEDVFQLVESVRSDSDLPIVAMISYSLVYRMGPEDFLDRACEAGLDGATIPDLPVEEMEELQMKAHERNFHLICFVTPATGHQRRSRVVQLAGGFIYYIAVRGITGERTELPRDLADNLCDLKSLTDVPVAVGFGVSDPSQARAVAREADGVIVGSAIVRRINGAHQKGDDPVEA